MAKLKAIICPYCGETQAADAGAAPLLAGAAGVSTERCRACGGLFEPLSRQATHNAMGPWQIRDERKPFQPGCSYETLVKLIERGQVTKHSIVRGPTTKQFWTIAKRVPGVSHLLGYCHNCDASVDAGDHGCHACGVPFGAYLDRNFLGLPEIRPLPWEAPVEEEIARESVLPGLDVRRAAQPLGISSFASDAELRNVGLSPMRGPAGQGGQSQTGADRSDPVHAPGRGAPWDIPAPSVAGAAAVEDAPSSRLAMRSLQRRVDDLRRTIRMLAVALVVVLALGIALALAAMRRGAAPEAKSAPHQASELPPPTTMAAADAPATQPSLADDEAQAQPPQAPSPDYARAQELIEQARQPERARAERIRDYQQALQILRRIDSSSTPSQRPVGLHDEIQRIERELESLQLEDFFP